MQPMRLRQPNFFMIDQPGRYAAWRQMPMVVADTGYSRTESRKAGEPERQSGYIGDEQQRQQADHRKRDQSRIKDAERNLGERLGDEDVQPDRRGEHADG